ncbi:MAG TPA: glycosyl hydrolase, partial [Planctomycetaceae bacterium]|nr:glycosyl hydrolase [Planctomycetaceae bacterium]
MLSQDGSGFQSTNPFNLLASDDQWSAPIMAEVGPDGCVWVIDWYNYIVQHNPTPHGFETGKGQAYETKLRDKRHGRIYRVVHEAGPLAPAADLSKASPLQLVEALRHPVMLVRKHAQRLLVERGKNDVILPLLELVNDRSYDAVGLNVGAIHALWVLHGLGQVHSKNVDVIKSVHAALKHPSPGVRRNAVQVLEPVAGSVDALTSAGLHLDRDANVRLAAVLALADLPATDRTANAVIQSLASSAPAPDRWIRDAATSAAASDGANFLIAVAGNAQWSESIGEVTRVVAGHYARSNPDGRLGNLLTALQSA